MKMKEVCTRTGLSERAVRLYCEEGLLEPLRSEVRGRVYLAFSEENVAELEQIAVLRGAGLSLEEIRTVRCEPHLIQGVLDKLYIRLEREAGTQEKVLERLRAMLEQDAPDSMAALAEALTPRREYCNGAVLRESGGYPASDDACSYTSNYTSLDRNIDRGRIVMRIYGVIYWVISAYTALVALAAYGLLVTLIVLGLQITVWIFLMRGALWARILHAISGAANALFNLGPLLEAWPHRVSHVYGTFAENGAMTQTTEYVREGSWGLFALLAGLILFYLASIYFLCFNRWVSDYLYDRSTR